MPRFRYACPTRWGDLDAQGHVNNATFVDYLQEARVEFLLRGPSVLHDLLARGVLVVAHQIEYLAPVPFDARPLPIELWVQALGGSRFSFGYDIGPADAPVGRARTVLAPYDLVGAGLRRLTPGEREELGRWLAPVPDLRAVARGVVGPSAHRFPIRVRWSDLDSYGHVNNVKFYEYVQEARIALLVETLGFTPGEIWLVARQDLEYLRPLDFRLDPYEVATVVSAVGNRSLTLEVALRDPADGTRYATARTVVVGPRPLSEAQRGVMEGFR